MDTRRSFLKKLFYLGGGTWALSSSFQSIAGIFAPAFEDELLDIRFANNTGALNVAECRILWKYFKFLSLYWDTYKYTNISTLKRFSSVLYLKTSQNPSYLFEYRSAIKILTSNLTSSGEIDYNSFLLNNTDEYSKKYVSLEFFHLNISSGGFKRYGFQNYSGFRGGRFDNPKNPPYRTH